MQTEKI